MTKVYWATKGIMSMFKSQINIHLRFNHHLQRGLATRDVVYARACDQKNEDCKSDNVWLITDHLNKEVLHNHFPTIESKLNQFGLSRRRPLPVAPLHYMVGGLSVDIDGRVLMEKGTVIPGLYAIGEVACTRNAWCESIGFDRFVEAVVFANGALII